MSKKSKLPGLVFRFGNWQIDKRINGKRVCESTGETDYAKAERYAIKRINEIHHKAFTGITQYTFDQASAHYIETENKRSLERDIRCLDNWIPLIGKFYLEQIHMDAIRPFINQRLKLVRSSTVMRELSVVRRILSLAARVWRDEHNRPWLETVPLISFRTLQQLRDKRKPYPLSWQEQHALFSRLPAWLAEAALFKVNTGTRQQEVCGLRWDYEIPTLNVFVIPGDLVKNGHDRVVVLNSVARSVVESRRGIHQEYVFTYRGKRVHRLNNHGWRNAWANAGLPVSNTFYRGVHNLKHTFGMRLRHAGVSLETRKFLLGHTNGDITTHYSDAQLQELVDAAEKALGSREIHEMNLLRLAMSRK